MNIITEKPVDDFPVNQSMIFQYVGQNLNPSHIINFSALQSVKEEYI
jgi:hypothetical protein